MVRAPLLLFVLVALGVVGMHTLGHPTGHAGPADPGHTATTSHVDQLADPHEPDPLMDPLAVCVAFLAGALVLLLVALTVVRRRPHAPGVTGSGAAAAGRGPPSLLGLRLADLSVLRT